MAVVARDRIVILLVRDVTAVTRHNALKGTVVEFAVRDSRASGQCPAAHDHSADRAGILRGGVAGAGRARFGANYNDRS